MMFLETCCWYFKTIKHGHTPPHTPKTFKACYLTHVLYDKNVFQSCSVLHVSIQKVFYSKHYKRKSFFSLPKWKQSCYLWNTRTTTEAETEIGQYLVFFLWRNDFIILPSLNYFHRCTLIKQSYKKCINYTIKL